MNHKPILAILLVLTLAFVFSMAEAQSGNLVYNDDFSLGTAGWNWHSLSGTETCCAGGYPPGAYPEAYAHPNGAGGYIVPWQNISDSQAGTYTLSGWIRTSGGPQSAWIQADNGDFNGRYCQTSPTNTQSWQQFSCSFSLGSSATIHVALAASNDPATAWGWVVWDSISLTRSGPTTYDLVQYMGRTSGNSRVYQFTPSNETMQVQWASSVWQGKPGFYQVKQPRGSPAHWEELSYGNTNIRRLRDTSYSETQWYGLYAGCPSACSLGAIWVRRYMQIGGTTWRSDNQVKVYNKSDCTKVADYHEESGIKLEAVYQTFTINGYEFHDVAKLTSYHDPGYTQPWEDYFYAKGVGLVKWHDYASGRENFFNGYSGTAPQRETVCTPLSPPSLPADFPEEDLGLWKSLTNP
jgi:hypothetical protein